MLSLLSPATWLIALALLAGSYGTGRWQQYQSDQKAQTALLLKATQEAREKEQKWSVIYKETTDAKETELRSIALERDAALRSLRNRPRERLPQTPSSCAGASPTALASSDSEVAIGWGVEFDTLRANYADCKAKLETR